MEKEENMVIGDVCFSNPIESADRNKSLMERKITADVEFKVSGEKTCEGSISQDDGNASLFLNSEAVTCYYEYPLKILFPSSATDGCCKWVYPMNFGGGMVEGDNINLSYKIGKRCCILITTLSFQKVYCCESGIDCQLWANYVLDSNALLCVIPDPTVCFKRASYKQHQTFHLASDANLVLLDWFTSGRYNRGERWNFTKLRSVSSIFINGQLQFREAQNLQDTPFLRVETAMKSYNIIGTCMVMGPFLEFLSTFILSKVGRSKGYGEKPDPNSLFAVSPLQMNGSTNSCGCIVRFAAASIPEAMEEMENLLFPLFTTLGANPFVNK